MLLIPRASPAFALVVLGLVQSVAAQGFVGNCTWQTGLLVADSFLGMYCNNDNWARYSYQWTLLDLDPCLVNNGGELVAYNNGNFTSSCTNCTVRGSPADFILDCACYQPDGKYQPAYYDLNRVLWNRNGSLGCFEHAGNKTEVGPF
ncbi:hypothetical protein F4780DRAFT_781370 [Xylariomycetidae sp. FL0641]|nr:hypothetical protein F4780DRAFT_781370 [Xylariomycetidae sp. FL0641]